MNDDFKTQASQISYHNRRGMMDPNNEDFGGEWIVLAFVFLVILGAIAVVGTFIFVLVLAIKWALLT